jgi:hypothetical protein
VDLCEGQLILFSIYNFDGRVLISLFINISGEATTTLPPYNNTTLHNPLSSLITAGGYSYDLGKLSSAVQWQ